MFVVVCLITNYVTYIVFCFFFFSSRRRHTRCREVSWARRCVQETAQSQSTCRKQTCQMDLLFFECLQSLYSQLAVSYTHLTLPTILLVQISVVAVSLKKKKNTHILTDNI
eukprot:TRINITY_DN8271_c0_g1_i1.p1 TRINITY_DN8271_c0_g1~~TRINITY_DN8271_c0_g1_i1.p1  ORF type:complete len:111 (-),score=31.87 TRINITY_DN8271_c0_g1_i1:22-354(-)